MTLSQAKLERSNNVLISDAELRELFAERNLVRLIAALDDGLDPNASVDGKTLLTLAADSTDDSMTSKLLERGANVKMINDNGSTALTLARDASVPALVRAGATVCDEDKSAIGTSLHYAVSSGRLATLKLLLSPVARGRECLLRIDDDGKTPLGSAVYFKQIEAVKLLLLAGADPNDQGATLEYNRPIAIAAEQGFTEISLALSEV